MKTMKSKDDFLVKGLEEVEPAYAKFQGNMYAGTLPSSHHDRVGEMMFWLFEPNTQKVNETMVLWLNGGPGCSSFNCGVMMEHSPVTQPLHAAGYCCIDSVTPKLDINPYSWTQVTTMLYVEYPIGTGFSYGSPLPETEKEAASDLDAFLQNFYQVFDHLQPYNFFVMGESYAGMFVPSVSRFILKANQEAIIASSRRKEKKDGDDNNDRFIVPLAGAALGNGWVNGEIQGPAVIDYSWYHGLIDKPTRDALHIEFENCMLRRAAGGELAAASEQQQKQPPPFHPFNVVDDCGMMWGVLEAAGNPNAYDITTWDPNVDQITFTSEAFYNSDEVKAALNAPTNITWHGCRWGSGRRRRLSASENVPFFHEHQQRRRRLYMDNDRPFDVSPYIAELLDNDIPVLVYNGDRDMTTNMVGQERILNAMEWQGSDEWLDAPRGLWKVDDYPAGWSKELDALSFVVVYNSGHMVPYNQPGPALDLVTRFLTKQSFMDAELKAFRIKPISTKLTNRNKDVKAEGSSLDTITSDKSSSSSSSNSLMSLPGATKYEVAGVAIVSMVVGFVLAMIVMRRRNTNHSQHRSPGGTYQRVPDANL